MTLRFHRAEPHPGEDRRYTTDRTYKFGTYVITKSRIGGWQAWSIEETPTHVGWWRISSNNKTMADARVAAQQHLEKR